MLFANFASQPALIQDAPPVSPVLLTIIAILLVILFIWLLLRERRAREDAVSSQIARAVPSAAVSEPAVRTGTIATPAAPVVDDLEIIEGIGPKIASVLKQAGITSFAQLAATEPARISEILHAANLRLADPGSWPEQARLAANGDVAALQALQDKLKGGR